jgi:HAD superfamily hydrolase (TIGR01549 family)
MVKAVLFDWDGVIADSVSFQHEWLAYCCGKFGKSYSFSSIDDLKANFKEPFTKVYDSFGFSWEKDKSEILPLFDEFMSKKNIPMYEGMKGTIALLKEESVKVAVVSSNRPHVIVPKAKEYGIYSLLDSIVGYEGDESMLKPNPGMINLCLKQMKVIAKDAVYVGDLPSDIKAAKSAGIGSIGVTWGYSKKDRLKLHEPDFIAEKPKDINEFIRSF